MWSSRQIASFVVNQFRLAQSLGRCPEALTEGDRFVSGRPRSSAAVPSLEIVERKHRKFEIQVNSELAHHTLMHVGIVGPNFPFIYGDGEDPADLPGSKLRMGC